VAALLPPRSMVGQLTLDQHIGVRIPRGQPTKSRVPAVPLQNSVSRVRAVSVSVRNALDALYWRGLVPDGAFTSVELTTTVLFKQ
jgi:hypothetical protein